MEKTPENRLRLQRILLEKIESLKVDAGKRRASLVVKEPNCSFEITWAFANGANATKIHPAKVGFSLKGHGEKFEYLDDIFVWKSDRNLSMRVSRKELNKDEDVWECVVNEVS